MKKLVVIAIMALTLTGCGKQEAQVVETEAQEPAMVVVEDQEEEKEELPVISNMINSMREQRQQYRSKVVRDPSAEYEIVSRIIASQGARMFLFDDCKVMLLEHDATLKQSASIEIIIEDTLYVEESVAEQVEKPERTVVRVDDYTEDGMLEFLEYMAHAEHTVDVEDMNENGISYVYTVNGTMEFDWNNLTVTQYAE